MQLSLLHQQVKHPQNTFNSCISFFHYERMYIVQCIMFITHVQFLNNAKKKKEKRKTYVGQRAEDFNSRMKEKLILHIK